MALLKNLEIARRILHNAVNLNIKKEIILKISYKIDKYVVEYYKNDGGKRKKGND